MEKYRGDASSVISPIPESRWRDALDQLGAANKVTKDRLHDVLTEQPPADICYYLNIRESRLRDRLVLDLMAVDAEGRTHPFELEDGNPIGLPESDIEIISLLFGAHGEARSRGQHIRDLGLGRCSVRPSLYRVLLPKLARTGRFFADLSIPGVPASGPISFDDSGELAVRLVVRRVNGRRSNYRLWGELWAQGVRYDLESPRILLSDGLALVNDTLFIVPPDECLDWSLRLRRHGAIDFPDEAKDQFLLELAGMPDLPDVSLPPELHWSQLELKPRPKVVFYMAAPEEGADEIETKTIQHVSAKVLFEYGGTDIAASSRETAVVDGQGRRWFRRDLASERRCLERMREIEFETSGHSEVRVARRRLSEVIRRLIEIGWSVESDGVVVRTNGKLRARVKSGIDWFDLEAIIDFGDNAVASFPQLLRAASAGREMLRLSDGSKGMVPSWVKKYAALARLGKSTGSKIRFLPSQAGIIDALLVGHEPMDTDLEFERLRDQLASAPSLDGTLEPEGFKGKLRDYQREGVAWMQFLAKHGYGGCLADDMGLGKTVQVLCLLQSRHPPQETLPSTGGRSPSLVVVPKSLVHNWVSEAGKFTQLKVVNYTGAKRTGVDFNEVDLIVTTYGTLRQEILKFTNIRFTTLILDEAQAIKNPRSQAAKACRLLEAELRLAISGTPIENGLEELWSLFEFLNPGMLGGLGDFAAAGRESDDAWLKAISRALKPFMLRRTKDEVLRELPGKTEQLWGIPLGKEEREQYDELCRYYRRVLSGVLDGTDASPQARVHVLEALLRLRQASCHPGLIDPTKLDEPSAKLDALFDKLEQIIPRGHKALVFSQFTTLLEIVRRRLERSGIQYAYLDGATADRAKTVTQFTDNEECAVFLISLKAGGCGLNLTQSDYVFILDPWWNPAIEAQAVDRAYRMGQKNRVFAYKMIAEDTVEQKIVALQQEKRRLADAIINTQGGPLSRLEASDLAALLGQESSSSNADGPESLVERPFLNEEDDNAELELESHVGRC